MTAQPFGAIFATLLGALITSGPVHSLAAEGNARAVTGDKQQDHVRAMLQSSLSEVGISSALHGCSLYEQVAAGVRDGEISYGAVCRLRAGLKSETTVMVCTATMEGGVSLRNGDMALTPDALDTFIRANCFSG